MTAPVAEPRVASSGDWPVDSPDVARSAPPRARRWFRWSATSLPVAPLLLLGMLLGPQGLFILTPEALSVIDPALPVALAMLGALVGLMPGLQGRVPRAIAGAAGTCGVTATIVAAGFAAGAWFAGEGARAWLWMLPLVLGIGAASSLVVPVLRSVDPLAGPTTTIESETLVSVVAGGLLLAFVRQGGFVATLTWLVQACVVVSVLGLAGYLLLRRSVADAERRVFAVATLLLVGGAADALSFSSLLGGLCAGLLWKVCGGAPRDSLQRDMLYALPPLLALVLIVAGARVEMSTIAVGLAAAYASLRTLGRVASGAFAGRLNPGAERVEGLSRLAPGVFGIAFVLAAFRTLGSDLSMAISVMVMGTIFSEVTGLLVAPRMDAE